MKKKLEAELISIAHRILKLKNKSELDQLHQEAQKLYEKLSVLKFVEENFADIQPTIGKSGAQQILETAFDENEAEMPAALEVKSEIPGQEAEKPENDPEEKEPEQEEIKEPEIPEEDKLEKTPLEADATPIEKEVDEVIAEAEAEIVSDAGDSETAGEAAEAPAAEVTASEETGEIEAANTETENTPSVETPVFEESVNFEEPESKEEVAAVVAETNEIKQEDLFKPTFEWAFEAKAEDAPPEAKEETKEQVAFEDLLGKGYVDPVFVKPEEAAREKVSYTADELPRREDLGQGDVNRGIAENTVKPDVIPISRIADKIPVFKMNNNEIADKTVSLNDRLSKGITVGLNDRIAFVKNLFNNSNEDYNRVLSQLITFDSFRDAQDFIENMVKPDYNNWEGKDEYAERFMEVVEKKFS